MTASVQAVEKVEIRIPKPKSSEAGYLGQHWGSAQLEGKLARSYLYEFNRRANELYGHRWRSALTKEQITDCESYIEACMEKFRIYTCDGNEDNRDLLELSIKVEPAA